MTAHSPAVSYLVERLRSAHETSALLRPCLPVLNARANLIAPESRAVSATLKGALQLRGRGRVAVWLGIGNDCIDVGALCGSALGADWVRERAAYDGALDLCAHVEPDPYPLWPVCSPASLFSMRERISLPLRAEPCRQPSKALCSCVAGGALLFGWALGMTASTLERCAAHCKLRAPGHLGCRRA